MNRKKLLRRLTMGAMGNVAFRDMVDLVEGFGFRQTRARGSHRIFVREGVRELLNLQDVGGQCKPYQIRQFLRIVERYNLELED